MATRKSTSTISELTTRLDGMISEGRRGAVLEAVRSLANTHSLEQILAALPEEDVDFIKSLKPVELVGVSVAPAAAAPVSAPAQATASESPTPKAKAARGKKQAPPRAPAKAKAPKAAKGKKAAGAAKAGSVGEKVATMIGAKAAGSIFKTGEILTALGDPSARVKVTAALNKLTEAKKIKRSGKGRSSFYTVVA